MKIEYAIDDDDDNCDGDGDGDDDHDQDDRVSIALWQHVPVKIFHSLFGVSSFFAVYVFYCFIYCDVFFFSCVIFQFFRLLLCIALMLSTIIMSALVCSLTCCCGYCYCVMWLK